MRHLLLALLAVSLSACESRTLVVESSAAWEGGIFGPGGSEFVEGSGDARFSLPEYSEVCWHFTAESGAVRVYVERGSITGPESASEVTEGAIAKGCDG